MYTFTAAQLEAMAETGRRAGLQGMSLVSENRNRAQRVCNGIGADWFPPRLRWMVGVACPHLIVISLPHDLEYFIGGGIWERWLADWHFLVNGFRMAGYAGSRKVAGKAIVLWLFLRFFGATAFNWHKTRKRAK